MYIKGDSLVLMDGETFAEISKMLMFKNKKKNVFDSISVNVVVPKYLLKRESIKAPSPRLSIRPDSFEA